MGSGRPGDHGARPHTRPAPRLPPSSVRGAPSARGPFARPAPAASRRRKESLTVVCSLQARSRRPLRSPEGAPCEDDDDMERASKSVAGFAVLLSGGWWGGSPLAAPWGHPPPRSVPSGRSPVPPGSVPRGWGRDAHGTSWGCVTGAEATPS